MIQLIKLKGEINKKFHIKHWKDFSYDTDQDYLGIQWGYRDYDKVRCVEMHLDRYIDNLEDYEPPGKSTENRE